MKYELPVAGPDKLGGIKVGDDFEIEKGGTLNIRNIEEMREQVQNLSDVVGAGKAIVASAITEKGVDTAANAEFSTMAGNILAIPKGGYLVINGCCGGIAGAVAYEE